MQKSQHTVIMTTVDRQDVADRIVAALMQKKLASCIQLLPITSCYVWQDTVNRDQEILMLIKARATLYPEIESEIVAQHTYELPEIIALPVTKGLPAYLGWIDSVSKKEKSD